MNWPRSHGPYDGSYSVDQALTLPLQCVWKRKMVGRYPSLAEPLSQFAGGSGRFFYMPVYEHDLYCVSLETGQEIAVYPTELEPRRIAMLDDTIVIIWKAPWHASFWPYSTDPDANLEAWPGLPGDRVFDETGLGELTAVCREAARLLLVNHAAKRPTAGEVQLYERFLSPVDGVHATGGTVRLPRENWRPSGILNTATGKSLFVPADTFPGNFIWISGDRAIQLVKVDDRQYVYRYLAIGDTELSVIHEKPIDSADTRHYSHYCVARGHILIVQSHGSAFEAHDVTTGERLWRVERDYRIQPWGKRAWQSITWQRSFGGRLVCDGQHVYCFLESTEFKTWHLVAISVDTGEKVWLSEPLKVNPGALTVEVLAIVDGTLLVQYDKELQAWRTEGEGPTKAAKVSRPKKKTPPKPTWVDPAAELRVISPDAKPTTPKALDTAMRAEGWALKVVDKSTNEMVKATAALPMYALLSGYLLSGPNPKGFKALKSTEALEEFEDDGQLTRDVLLSVERDTPNARVVYHLNVDGVDGEFQGLVASALQRLGGEIELNI